jgi:beta-lactamase regulating signal transducer with metallopeptidase domain/mono/diheme cytochrome c family protein
MSALLLLEITAKTSIVLSAAWGVARLMAGRSSAAGRHLLWSAASLAMLFLPVLVVFGPEWRVAEVPDRWVAGTRTAMAVPGVRARAGSEVWPDAAADSTHAPMVADSPRAASPQAGGRRLLQSTAGLWPPSWPALLVGLWACGVVLGLSSLVAGLLRAGWLARHAVPLTTPPWSVLSAEAKARLGVRRPVRLLMTHRVAIPVTCGIVRPALLLPLESESWDAGRRRVVLLHEFAHVRRRDCLVQAIAYLAWAVHWFNPLAFVAVSRLRAEQECACDDLVLSGGTPAAEYAGHLCDIASTARSRLVPAWTALAIAHPSRLEARVRAILDDARSRRLPSLRTCAAIAAATCLGSFSLGAMRVSTAVQAMGRLSAINVIAPYSTLISAPEPGYVGATQGPADAAPRVSIAEAPGRTAAPGQEVTADGGRAFLESCSVCHNSTRKTANLAFDTLDVERVADHPEVWERVVRKLRSGLHPPAGVSRPGRAAADAFSASIEAALDRADRATWSPGVAEQLSQVEIASRLSRFLWNAEADETLRKLAASGRLSDPSVLQQQVRRMIADSRSAAMQRGFFGQWLFLKNLPTIKPDPSVFPDFDEDLRGMFQRETDLFLASQVREDRPVTDLLTADYSFLNERLAQYYGVGNVRGSQFRRVRLADAARAGVLGHASVLSVTSYANRTSPVLRGKFVLETFLGVSPPPPPPNVPALEKDAERPIAMRARMDEHRKNPVCAACHMDMDPLGYALENFDAIGRWRNVDGGAPIDASGTLADGSSFDGPAQMRDVLLDRREAIVNTITLRLLAYALGRPARYSDMSAVRGVIYDAAPGNYKWSSIILGVVRSAPFQMKRLE